LPDPDRDIISYVATLGISTGDYETDLQLFLDGTYDLARGNWDTDYLAESVINYIRAGYGLPPI